MAIDSKVVAKKTTDTKPAETKPAEKKLTLTEKLNDINFKNKQAKDMSDMQAENKKLKDMIASQKKSSRGPSNSTRISGLQTLNTSLGQQFSKQ
jgi:hypothetical protein